MFEKFMQDRGGLEAKKRPFHPRIIRAPPLRSSTKVPREPKRAPLMDFDLDDLYLLQGNRGA